MPVDPILIERWLAARELAEIRSAWAVLPSVIHPAGNNIRKYSLYGAALLAEAMTGHRADWIVDYKLHGAPVYDSRGVADGSVLDHCWNIKERCDAALKIHERRDGLRGVQLISVGAGSISGPPEGGGMVVVRVFDRDRAAIIPIDAWDTPVATIGEVDLAPLDLLTRTGHFYIDTGSLDVATARALTAQLAAEIDAHYDTSPLWAEGAAEPQGDWYMPDNAPRQTFRDGERAVTIAREGDYKIWAEVHGLPWGQRLGFSLTQGLAGYFLLRFSNADLDRIEARISAIGRLN